MEARLQSSEFRVVATEAKAQSAEERAATTRARAVEEYKKSKNFEDEVAEGSYNVYQFGFIEYKKKVVEAFLGLNLDGIVNVEPEKEGAKKGEASEAEEATKGVADVKAKQAREAIAKMFAEAKVVIKMAVKAFEASSTPTPKEPTAVLKK